MNDSPQKLHQRLSDLNENLKNLKGGIMAFWTAVRAGQVVEKISGLSKTAMHRNMTELERLQVKKKDYAPAHFSKFVKRVEAAYSIYLSSQENQNTKNPIRYNAFYNKTWALYFFNDNGHGTVELGRIILSITTDGIAYIKNLPGQEGFKGTFQLLDNHIGIFDMEGAVQPSKKFYIQAIMGSVPKDIALGGLIKYVNNTVVTGKLVLEIINENNGKLEPSLLSWKNNHEDFYKVDPAIRHFLCQRVINSFKLPNHTFTTQNLSLYLKNYQPQKQISFFNAERPIIFIATPTNSISQEAYKQNLKWIKIIVHKIKEALPQVVINSLKEIKWSTVEPVSHLINSLEVLKHTDLFVLIHPGSQKVSFSLVETAWALVFCKKIMLFYQKGTIPKQLPEFRNTYLNVSAAREIKDLETDHLIIADRIIHEMRLHLEMFNFPLFNQE